MQIINVMAASLDGRIASHPNETDVARQTLGFTTADDRAHLLALLDTADAVIVGRSSLMASGGAFARRNHRGAWPIWAVLTNTGLPEDAGFFRQVELPRWLVSSVPLALPPAAAGVRNLVTGAAPPARTLVDAFASAKVERALLFGGSEINRQFYAEGLVDRLILTLCPLILGASTGVPLVAPDLPEPVRLTLVASQPQGNLVFLEYHVQKQ